MNKVLQSPCIGSTKWILAEVSVDQHLTMLSKLGSDGSELSSFHLTFFRKNIKKIHKNHITRTKKSQHLSLYIWYIQSYIYIHSHIYSWTYSTWKETLLNYLGCFLKGIKMCMFPKTQILPRVFNFTLFWLTFSFNQCDDHSLRAFLVLILGSVSKDSCWNRGLGIRQTELESHLWHWLAEQEIEFIWTNTSWYPKQG